VKPRTRIHIHCRSARLSLAALGAGLSLALPDGSAAEQDTAMQPLTELIDHERLAATDLAERLSPEPEDRQSRPPSWMGENFFYQKGVGLEYRQELRMGDHPVELGLQGPLHRKKKRVGLMVELRF
jgi:hypothetical protein